MESGARMNAVRVDRHGGVEELRVVDMDIPTPGSGQALIRVAAAGVNYIDIYQRSGYYPVSLPFVPGIEAAGTVEALGDDDGNFADIAVGSRVVCCNILGGYAQWVIAPIERLIPVPDDIDFDSAAAVAVQGLTAHYLAHDTYPIAAGDWVCILAAAGGVGLLLTQIAKSRGARVIGAVSTAAKERLAREAGADEIIRYDHVDMVAEVRRLTDGVGAAVVYDSVGRDTFLHSLDCLRLRGMLVSYGQSSGAVEPFAPRLLSDKGSLFVTRPNLFHYITDRHELLTRADALFGAIAAKTLKVRIDRVLPLAEARRAHELLGGRNSAGKLLLRP